MKLEDAIIAAVYELLVENATMKQLLANRPNLKEALEHAKADPSNEKVFGQFLEPLRTAIADEVENQIENEKLIQRLLARIPPDAKVN